MDLFVIPECYVDTNLIETLVPTVTGYNHQKGCGTVAKVMNQKFADRFAVGIIDKDKKALKYLEDFTEVCRSESLILHKHNTRHHYFVQIFPAVEKFILEGVRTSNLTLARFGLPDDLAQFKKISKTVNSKQDPRFRHLFKAMKKCGVVEILRLAAWITYLKENQYHADISTLKGL